MNSRNCPMSLVRAEGLLTVGDTTPAWRDDLKPADADAPPTVWVGGR